MSGSGSSAVVEIEGASFGYGGAPVLRGVSFSVREGEAVALIGPNGAGKSTVLAGILGLAQHEARVFRVPTARGEIGTLPQSSEIDPAFPVTLEQVVAMGRTPRLGLRWPGGRDRRIVADALAAVGLAEHRRTRFGDLSGGQRQRGLLARALASEPRLLLLDEPFNGLDQGSRDALIETIRRLKERGVALLITTHDLELARAVCERTLLVNREQIAFDETGCVLTLEQVEAAFASHVMEIDGHTLATTEHHAAEHAGHHDDPGPGHPLADDGPERVAAR
ncbi:metal ABC transporter ATP-binding protein [Agrococcus carbonis]|uniref:Manganese/iron transport system ATP-binding protein n=1 Tax=Agrococcus carbonis TaxID=684552 RepID=A0A1H1PJQ5_9MICO|nr:metal ABC transporter ATP-binding protein [Agrococcus carbonis]SDS11436.1 manganese/iron transport system ATP-binding protein [Agrococcus carbonis]